ncbi:MAG: stage III sporulation protein AE [Firmicutes bacterium]|nr:stage III sporulation protein AE [Bacillota bacterium]
MKRLVAPLALLALLWLLCPAAYAAEAEAVDLTTEALLQLQADGDWQAFTAYLQQLESDLAAQGIEVRLLPLLQALLRGEAGSFHELWQALPRLIGAELAQVRGLLAQLLALALLSLLLSLLADATGGQVAQVAGWAVFLLLLQLAAGSFGEAMLLAQQAVQSLADLFGALLPVLMLLLASLGGVTTVALLDPLMLLMLSAFAQLLATAVFPLIYGAALLQLVGQISPQLRAQKLAGLLRDAGLGLLGICTTLFLAVLGLAGVAGAAADGLAFRAAKTASGAFIPFIGRTLADALDSVLSTLLLLKNAVGVVAALAILLVCALPALRLLILALAWRLMAALTQLIGDERLSALLSSLGTALMQLFAVVGISGLVLFFSLALVVLSGNMLVMFR